MPVVGHIGHLVGAQTVGLCDGIEVAPLLIGNDQTVVFLDLDL